MLLRIEWNIKACKWCVNKASKMANANEKIEKSKIPNKIIIPLIRRQMLLCWLCRGGLNF